MVTQCLTCDQKLTVPRRNKNRKCTLTKTEHNMSRIDVLAESPTDKARCTTTTQLDTSFVQCKHAARTAASSSSSSSSSAAADAASTCRDVISTSAPTLRPWAMHSLTLRNSVDELLHSNACHHHRHHQHH